MKFILLRFSICTLDAITSLKYLKTKKIIRTMKILHVMFIVQFRIEMVLRDWQNVPVIFVRRVNVHSAFPVG